jgi:galactonate dehydratase
MKITGINVSLVAVNFRNAIFTEIETDEGITGISETVLKRFSKTIAENIKEHGRFLIGKDPARIEDLYEKLYRDSFWVGGPMMLTAISAIEIALWDILGKQLGTPVYRLLGGPTRDEVLVYCHVRPGASPAEAGVNARAMAGMGYKAIKVGLPIFSGTELSPDDFSGAGSFIDKRYKETEFLSPHIFTQLRDYFVAMRSAVGDEVELSVDVHGRLSPANSLRFAEAVKDVGLLFMEEPAQCENVDALAWVAARSPVPVAAGERIVTIYGARELVEKNAVAIFQPDIVNCGGLSQGKKMAAMAESHYISVAPHNPNGPLATVTGLHFAASIPNFFILELHGSQVDLDVFADLIDPPIQLENGRIKLPTGPGLGVRLRKENFAKYPYVAFSGTR